MHRLLVFYPLDPRGSKVGGIETHIRLILANFPKDFSVLFVGVDEIGDRQLGVIAPLELGGRIFDFMPVVHIPQTEINLAAKTVFKSTTLRFVIGVLRYILVLREAVKSGKTKFIKQTVELQRFETALIPRLLSVSSVQTVHGEGSKDDKMDSLIKRFWFIHSLNERIALFLAKRIICVNANIVERMKRLFPKAALKAEIMSVSVDTALFKPEPFNMSDGIFKIVFAGRLDEFKDPPLMFKCFELLSNKLNGKFEFHYIGTSDPSRYPEFEAIKHSTILHGFQPATHIAKIATNCHAGVLTSFFEGMPCYLLEVLSVGRPFGAIWLPQYESVVKDGINGKMVERCEGVEQSAETLSEAFMQIWSDIKSGRIDPFKVHECIEPFSVKNQMSRLFEIHRQLCD